MLFGTVALIIVIALVITTVNCIGSCTSSGKSDSVQTMLTEPEGAVSSAQENNAGNKVNSNVSQDYFDDAVFVGDSVTLSFSNYVEKQREKGIDCLGDAYILCAGSLGYTNSLLPVGDPNCVLPVYQGVQQPLEESIAQIGAKKAYIMLGMNDVGAYELDDIMENVKTVIGNIKDKSPGIRIYIESVTPIIKSMQGKYLNNEAIRAFNERMKSYAAQNGYAYLDIYSVVADDEGYLRDEYCGDPDVLGMHFLENADAAWEAYLLSHPEGK